MSNAQLSRFTESPLFPCAASLGGDPCLSLLRLDPAQCGKKKFPKTERRSDQLGQ